MGGKPQKPKIQAYVDRRWFDEFEVYRSSHNLNQSKALEKILAEFFGGPSKQALPSEQLETAIAPALVDALRAELAEFKQELEQRLQLVESRLGLESAPESATTLNGLANESALKPEVVLAESAFESASELATPVDGLANESATHLTESASASATSLNELVAKSADKSATALDESASELVGLVSESADESASAMLDGLATDLANSSAVESANLDTTTALEEVAESANSSAVESAIEIEEAIALNTLEDSLEPTTASGESVEVLPSATSDIPIDRASVETAIAPNLEKVLDNASIPASIPEPTQQRVLIETPTVCTVKPGKQPPEEIRKIVEARLAFGQRVSRKDLATLIGKSSEAVRQRRETGSLHEWGVQLVTGSRPEEFERI